MISLKPYSDQEIEALRVALLAALEKARARGGSVHLFLDDEGFFCSEFIPRVEPGNTWLRVTQNGRIEDGRTRHVLGQVQELER